MTTCEVGHLVTAATMVSMSHESPSGSQEAYRVSQNQQRRLHPLVRIKTLGVPVSRPSPWTLWKISEIRITLASNSRLLTDQSAVPMAKCTVILVPIHQNTQQLNPHVPRTAVIPGRISCARHTVPRSTRMLRQLVSRSRIPHRDRVP